MAQARTAICRYYESEGNCEKDFEGTFKKACQTCSYYSPIQKQTQKKKKASIEPDDLWRKKKAKDRNRAIKRQMIEDLENEDGVR